MPVGDGRRTACLALALAVAGCAAPALPTADTALPRLTVEGAEVVEAGLVRWLGVPVVAGPDDACGPANCRRFAFDFALPEGFWEARAGALEVSAAWPTPEAWNWRSGPNLQVTVYHGEMVAEGDGSQSQVVLLDRAPPGRYEVQVLALRQQPEEWWSPYEPGFDATTFELAAQVELPAPAEPLRDLLPNLVTLPPKSLRLADPPDDDTTEGRAVRALAGAKGCYASEVVEAGARRCLRFQNAVGNVGAGPLTLVQRPGASPSGALTGVPMLQRIARSDGSHVEEPAGVADYHPQHGHMHYRGFMDFRLHAYDLEQGFRGEPLGEGRKTGLCSGDIALAAVGLPGTVPGGDQWEGCLPDPADPGKEMSMGLNPGWYDPYSAINVDQYVDLAGLPDGVYELVLTTNQDGALREERADDNEASAVFRLRGDDVEVLQRRGWTG